MRMLRMAERPRGLTRTRTCGGAWRGGRDPQCYYIGATDDAASSVLKDVTGALATGAPRELVCERLKKRDAVLCELKYESAGTVPRRSGTGPVPR